MLFSDSTFAMSLHLIFNSLSQLWYGFLVQNKGDKGLPLYADTSKLVMLLIQDVSDVRNNYRSWNQQFPQHHLYQIHFFFFNVVWIHNFRVKCLNFFYVAYCIVSFVALPFLQVWFRSNISRRNSVLFERIFFFN